MLDGSEAGDVFCCLSGSAHRVVHGTAEGQRHSEGPGTTSQAPLGWSYVPKFCQPESGTLLSCTSASICKMPPFLARLMGSLPGNLALYQLPAPPLVASEG